MQFSTAFIAAAASFLAIASAAPTDSNYKNNDDLGLFDSEGARVTTSAFEVAAGVAGRVVPARAVVAGAGGKLEDDDDFFDDDDRLGADAYVLAGLAVLVVVVFVVGVGGSGGGNGEKGCRGGDEGS